MPFNALRVSPSSLHPRQVLTVKLRSPGLVAHAKPAVVQAQARPGAPRAPAQPSGPGQFEGLNVVRPSKGPEGPVYNNIVQGPSLLNPADAIRALDTKLNTPKLPSCCIPAELSNMVPAGGKKVVRIFGHDILLLRNAHGQLFALDDECPHAGASLSQGTLRGSEITCCYHGSVYNRRGECTSHHAGAAKTYDVTEENGVIFVGLRGLAGADRHSTGEMIPFLRELAEPGFDLVVRRKDVVKNHFSLMFDNTASVEHLTGVHHIPVPARNVKRFDKTVDRVTTEFEQPFEPNSPIAKIIGADHIIARINERPPYASFVELRAPFVDLTYAERQAKEAELGRRLNPDEMRRRSKAGEGKRGQIFMFTVPTNSQDMSELITIYRLNAIDFSWLGENAVHHWITKITSKVFVEPQVVKAIVEDRDVIEKQIYREGDDLRAFRSAAAARTRAIRAEDQNNPKPRVLVFGATGETGKATVRDLLDAGHKVTAFVRNLKSLDIKHIRLTLVQGDICDADQVRAAVPGHEAVILAVGASPRKFTDVASRGTQAVVDAMQEAGVKRLVCVTSYGLGGTFERLNKIEQLAYNMAMKEQLADKAIQEEIIQRSSLDWTLLRPRMLNNKKPKFNRKNPKQDPLEVFASAEGETCGSSVSRAAVARFAARAIMDKEAHGKAYALSQK